MTKVLKFKEFVNEGLWSKTLNRGRNGEMRKEDMSKYFDIFNLSAHVFSARYISNEHNKYHDFLNDKYRSIYRNYMENHGFIDINNKINLPDSEYSYNISKLDEPNEIKIKYENSNRKFSVTCTINNNDINITDTVYGEYLKDLFFSFYKGILNQYPQLIDKNIKKNWDSFERELYECTYEGYTEILNDYFNKYNKIKKFEDIYFSTKYISDVLKKDYMFGSISFDGKGNPTVYYINSTYTSDKFIISHVVDIFRKSYNSLTRVSEGLWSKTLNRGRTGGRRLEDSFLKSDLDVFDNWVGLYSVKKYNLNDTIIWDYVKLIKNTYGKFIINYAKAHGTLDMGFTLDDSAKMPDFDFSFHIKDLKNVFVHITYTDDYKEFKMMCGNNRDEFDITETEFGKYMYGIFSNQAFDVLEDHMDILYKNIEMNFDKFEEVLHDYVYDCCYLEMEYDVNHGLPISKLGGIEIDTLHQNKNMMLKKFYFDGVEVNSNGQYIVNLCGDEIQDTHIGKRILEIYKEAYKDALDKIEKRYPYVQK